MNAATVPILAAIIIQVALGLVVFQAHPSRKSNQCFLLLSLVAAAWLSSLYFAFTATNSVSAEGAIRGASTAVPLVLVAFNILRLSIRERRRGWRSILRHCRLWLIAGFAIVWLCQTKFFLSGVILPQNDHPSQPIYGPGIIVHRAFFAISILILIITYIRDLRRASGSERTELAFILIGATSAVGFSILAATILRFFVDPSQLFWFAPFRPVLFSLVIAYGIATRKIMEVGLLLRRIISYGLLTAYLLSLYVLVWWLGSTALHSVFINNSQSIAHVA